MNEAMYDLLFIVQVFFDIIFSLSVMAFVIQHITWSRKFFKESRGRYEKY